MVFVRRAVWIGGGQLLNVVPRRLSRLDSRFTACCAGLVLTNGRREFGGCYPSLSRSVLNSVGNVADNGFRSELVPLNKLPHLGSRIA